MIHMSIITFLIYLGKASKNQVLLVFLKTTLRPDINGEWRITAPTSCRDAKSTVGTVPILCPYKIMVSGLILSLEKYSKNK